MSRIDLQSPVVNKNHTWQSKKDYFHTSTLYMTSGPKPSNIQTVIKILLERVPWNSLNEWSTQSLILFADVIAYYFLSD